MGSLNPNQRFVDLFEIHSRSFQGHFKVKAQKSRWKNSIKYIHRFFWSLNPNRRSAKRFHTNSRSFQGHLDMIFISLLAIPKTYIYRFRDHFGSFFGILSSNELGMTLNWYDNVQQTSDSDSATQKTYECMFWNFFIGFF